MICQRLAEDDISGVILDKQLGYDHIMLPMRAELSRIMPTKLGYEDPRTYEGQLLFPDRFPEEVVDRDERVMGKWATAGQNQQAPVPRGGGIIPRDAWVLHDKPEYPNFDLVIGSLDTAYTLKEENDPSAMTVWGFYTGGEQTAQAPTRYINKDEEVEAALKRQYTQEHTKMMMIYAWTERLELYELVERVADVCKKYQIDVLLIENKAAGHSVAQELRRVYGHEDFGVTLIDPKNQDKLSRLYSVQHLFNDGLISAPDRPWADVTINQVASFPKAKHDDLVDTVSQALTWARKSGVLMRGKEHTNMLDIMRSHSGKPPPPLYPV